MRRIVLSLTDEEYSLLETQAQTQRRSVREMAGFLVTRPQPTVIMMQPPVPIGPAPINPIWPPNVWCGTVGATRTSDHTVWNNLPLSIGISPDA